MTSVLLLLLLLVLLLTGATAVVVECSIHTVLYLVLREILVSYPVAVDFVAQSIEGSRGS